MYKELGLSEADGVLAAYNAVCELAEATERLQAACAAKEAELAELRGQTVELFGARLEAEGMGEEAVTSAKAMWQSDPQSAAQAVLGCDIAEAANPWGCNQYGHRKGHNGGQSGSEGERGNRTNNNKKATLTDTEAESLTDDMFEIAMEEGGYEKLYDVPKEKLKAVIKQELMKSGSRDMFGNYDTGEDGNSAKYRWWRKNVKRIVDSLDDDVKSSRTLEELLDEEEIVKSSHYDGYEIDEEVDAANPYGCNQYGHEWRGKHGEGWKPRGRGGEQKEKKDASTEKTVEEEVDEYENESVEERRLKMLIWERDLQQAKDKALDIRESTKYRQRDPETVKQYEEAKKEANERAKRLRAIRKAIGERRGWDKKKIDYMLRRFPETVIDF